MTKITLLGPQRHSITVTEEIERLNLQGRIAVITAGWQEREAEDDELQEAIGHRAVNLLLHHRAERMFHEDAELFHAHRARQDLLRQMQDLYRVRLDAYLGAAQALHHRGGPEDLLAPECDGAVATLRELDRHHLERIHQVHARFDEEMKPSLRWSVCKQRDEIAETLADCPIVAIAGGNVATLLTRIRLLGVDTLLHAKAIVAWSAGAMVLTDRVVLFHDRPPEGPGNAEVLDVGLGLVPRVVALPHATKRLRMDDTQRMALFARRFSPSMCLALDPFSRARWDGETWQLHEGTWVLGRNGQLGAVETPAAP